MENERVQTFGRRVEFERFFGDPGVSEFMDMGEEVEKKGGRGGDEGKSNRRVGPSDRPQRFCVK